MAITQERIRDLTTYTGTETPDNVFIPVDSSAFGSKPFKIPISDFINNSHIEKGILSGLLSSSVSVTFDDEFASMPLTAILKVYRVKDYGTSYLKEDVLYTFTNNPPISTTGFSLTIDASESLTGVIIEYKFEES